MDFKNFDASKLKRLMDPNAAKDLDKFLDNLPTTVGYNALIAAGFTWLLAAGAVLFAMTEASKVAELRTELLQVESLQPPVPVIEFVPVNKTQLESFIESVERINLYPVLTFRVTGDGKLEISSKAEEFTAMTYAIGHVQGGGKNWKVEVDSMCIGPECQSGTLRADLKITTIKVGDAPAPPAQSG